MKRLFLDESGECSFSTNSNYTHFLITILSIDSQNLRLIKKLLKRRIATLINNGWNKNIEPKASSLYRDPRFRKFIPTILTTLANISSLEISYIVVNKDKITNQSFRNSAYGISYNFFTGILLSDLVFKDGFNDLYLIYDRRNKETHKNLHFQEYLETIIIGKALTQNTSVTISAEGLDSDQCYGLLAVDYFSWAIFRKFEKNDASFFNLFLQKLKRRKEWYI